MCGKQNTKFLLQKKVWLILLVCVFAVTSWQSRFGYAQESSVNNWQIFLPLVRNGLPPFETSQKFIGIYMQQYWTENTVSNLAGANQLAGKQHSVVGWFIDLQDIAFTSQNDMNYNNFYRQLEALWNAGYISFVNLNIAAGQSSNITNNCPYGASAYEIARGDCDKAIKRMAELYKNWIDKGDGRIAFLAPLPEMNGVNSNGEAWKSYGGDADNFKLAYQKMLNIFHEEGGVRKDQVWWVFAPNGWSTDQHAFENYYPGNSLVDVIGFSSYNYGYCRVAIPWQKWENYATLFAPYLERIRQMDASKPIIIAQTGTTAEYSNPNEKNTGAKNNWLKENYEYLAGQSQVLGILYYDYDQTPWECNWRILPGETYNGYTQGVGHKVYQYLTAENLKSIIP